MNFKIAGLSARGKETKMRSKPAAKHLTPGGAGTPGKPDKTLKENAHEHTQALEASQP